MTRIIQFVVTTSLILTLVACGSDDDSALRDQIAMLEMELDEAAIARMTAERQVADRQAEVAGLQAEVEQLNGEITILMSRADISATDLAALRSEAETLRGQLAGRADISPVDLAALQAGVAALRSEIAGLRTGLIAVEMERDEATTAKTTAEDQVTGLQAKVETLTGRISELEADGMAAGMEQQARLDAQAMAAVGHPGLARSPHPPAYAMSDQDTLANLQPGGEGVFAPLSSVLRRARNVRFPDDGAAYVKSISGDGEGGFNMTWVIDGVESPVHFPADAYNPENFGFQHTDEAGDHHRSYWLFGWTDSLYPEFFPGTTEDRTDGSTQFDYLDLLGWGLYLGQDDSDLQGMLTYGVRTLPDSLPAGSVTWKGLMYANQYNDAGTRLNRDGVVTLEADLDDMTISGRIDGIHVPAWASASGQNEPLEGSYIDIESGSIHDAVFAQQWTGHGPMSGETMLGFRGALAGEFYGPSAEEVGGVLSGWRPSMNDSPDQHFIAGFGAVQAK